jgi:hypothetical protein
MENKLIYERIALINKEVEAIGKNQENTQQHFKYRGVDQVLNELHNLFAKHDVFITSEVLNSSREERQSKSGGTLIWSIIDYKFILHTIDGSFIETTARGEAMDSGDKGSNKCISVALKYVMFNMFLIPTEEMIDPDKMTPELAAKKEAKKAEKQEKVIEIIMEVERCETLDGLTLIWEGYKELRENTEYRDAIAKMNTKLTKKSNEGI